MRGAKRGALKTWQTLRRIRWHQNARLLAALVLLDQAIGPLSTIPSSEAVVVVALGALFAPIPTEKK